VVGQQVTGTRLKEMLRGAVVVLEKNKEQVNALNVFPVPDGDTGTNMGLTISAALQEAEKVTGDLSQVARAASTGSLMGARGNSGVILSQFFRGVAVAWADKSEAGPKDIAEALLEATRTAYRAVMKPVEGTMLTVARIAGKEASVAARQGGDVETVLKAALAGAKKALLQTPSLLPVLKEAGVVDAGGQGIVYILEGAVAAYSGQDLAADLTDAEPSLPIMDHAELFKLCGADLPFGYCTEVLLRGTNLAEGVVKNKIRTLGDSMLVVGDSNIIKVHIHTNHPGQVLEQLVSLGSLHDIKIDNLSEQQAQFEQGSLNNQQPQKTKALGSVAVALGEGIKAIFEGLGVDVVLTGGQTMNPSTEELLAAIDSTGAENVLVLPNNKNVILAAKQAEELSSRKVKVIPTKSIAQGIGAMVAFNPDVDVESNVQLMTTAGQKVDTAEITYAVRSTRINGREIMAGDIMGLVNDKLAVVGKEVAQVALEVLDQIVTPENELITLLYGEDVSAEDAKSLLAAIEERFTDCDVEMHAGGQPLYYYILAVE
jgi:DAK2 domain fusion protein YloV